jgi:hydrogenase maturation protease
MKKIGVIGIGNPLRKDDGIGIVLLEKLVEIKDDLPDDIEYIDGGTGGMNLLHLFARFDIVVFIDAVNFGGEIAESKFFNSEDVISKNIQIKISTHGSDILKIIQLSKELGENPDEIFIFGVQPQDMTPGTRLSHEIQENIDLLVNNLKVELKNVMENTE